MDERYKSSIPEAATEHITSTHENGFKAAAEYILNDQVVGTRLWDEQGYLEQETPLKGGLRHGTEYSWYFDGLLTLTEPYEEGLVHGTAKQWAADGTLLGTYTLIHGTGIDLWRGQREDGSVRLAEVYYMRDGCRHGYEWWLNEDQASVYIERHWWSCKLHGIEREWNEQGRLRRGYPKYFVSGKQVTKQAYLKAAETDPTLPRFRAEDNEPARTFPPEISRELGVPE